MIRVIVLLFGLFFFQSCALVTSCKSFTLDGDKKTSFEFQKVFTDNYNQTVIFFEEGTFLSISPLDPEHINEYLLENKYKIYRKFDDYRFDWGVYVVSNDTVTIELQEKVHQWGIIEICRWHGIISDNILQIAPIRKEVNNDLDFYTFSKNGVTLNMTNEILFEKEAIDPKLSWVNN